MFENSHESLLISKRGELPPFRRVEARPDLVLAAPRLEHSAKPPEFYDLDRSYVSGRSQD